jgi:hypothetical protein
VVKGRRIMKKDYLLNYQPRFCKVFSPARISEKDSRWND